MSKKKSSKQPTKQDLLPSGYSAWIENIKERIRTAQIKAVLSVNRELILLYWQIGRDILQRQGKAGWGAKIIDHIAGDLRKAFPDMKGFSPRNLKYMRAFAEAWPEEPFVQQAVAQIPWGHNVRLLDLVKEPEKRKWYIQQTITYGWSRSVLEAHIESRLYEREGKALTNFQATLPAPDSDLAQQLTKDPYNLDFISLSKDAHERELEKQLTEHIQKFLIELGAGFAFVGRQYHLEVGGEDFYIDLLMYHLKLRCYVVLDLKMKPFKPEFAGKMNFYLSAVDDLLRHPDDKPTIGIILCKEKSRVVTEYALRDTNKPVGISSFHFTEALPENLKGKLPSIEEFEEELGKDVQETE